MPAAPALADRGHRARSSLEAKEGLSLLNGTQFMAAIGCLAVGDGEALLDSADLIGAMSIEGLRGSVGPFQERIQHLRPIPGQLHTARHVRAATEGSEIMLSHLNCDKVQDAYSIRCIPQVHGACRDALRWLREVARDRDRLGHRQPAHLPRHRRGDLGRQLPRRAAGAGARPGGHEHGRDRQHERAPHLPHADAASSRELPPYLTAESGLNNGYMIAQYTAAALVAENRILCHPASVDSIPTSGDQEDHVSMGMTAALKLLGRDAPTRRRSSASRRSARRRQSTCWRRSGPAWARRRGYELVRGLAEQLVEDRYLAPEIERVAEAVEEGRFAEIVRSEA